MAGCPERGESLSTGLAGLFARKEDFAKAEAWLRSLEETDLSLVKEGVLVGG